jgi:hypothetical protein
VHDTSRVHDTAKVHDTKAGRDEIDLRKPVAPAAPQPSAEPEAPAPRRDVEGPGPGADTPALAPWERSAWDDLDDQLASIQRQLRSEVVATPPPAVAAPAPTPTPEPKPAQVPVLVPEPAREPAPVPDLVGGSPRPASSRLGRRPLLLVAAVAVGLLLAVAGGFALTTSSEGGSESSGLTRQESAQLASWLRSNTREDAVIAAPSDLRPVLEDGLPHWRIVSIEDDRDQATDLVVLPRGWRPPLPGLVVASLGTRAGTVDVVKPRRDAATGEAELARRVQAGRRLVESVNLRLTPRAWTMLANGQVDLSVASLLRALLKTHTVEVSSFPRDPLTIAAGAPARTVDITSLSGPTPNAKLIQTLRVAGARTHVGQDRGHPALVVDLPITG